MSESENAGDGGPPDIGADVGVDVGADQVDERAQLLPEEQAVGSDDPHAQAEAILQESLERTDHPDPDDGSQSGSRRSTDTL